MKEITVGQVTQEIRQMCIDANYYLPSDVKAAMKKCYAKETWQPAKDIMDTIFDNIALSKEQDVPMCQDTGVTCVIVELGQDVHISGGSLEQAINEGVRQGYEDGFLRKSVVGDPLQNRPNTGDNTPAFITWNVVPGDNLRLVVAPKGFGSENMSRLAMLPPSAGEQGVVDFVVETVCLAGSNPCPPVVVGVGIGGNFDKVAALAKKALLRPLNVPNPQPYYASLEKELLEKVNAIGIGPQGFGGRTTAIGLNIETFPTHIAGLPVAVNINCHVTRHVEVVL